MKCYAAKAKIHPGEPTYLKIMHAYSDCIRDIKKSTRDQELKSYKILTIGEPALFFTSDEFGYNFINRIKNIWGEENFIFIPYFGSEYLRIILEPKE